MTAITTIAVVNLRHYSNQTVPNFIRVCKFELANMLKQRKLYLIGGVSGGGGGWGGVVVVFLF